MPEYFGLTTAKRGFDIRDFGQIVRTITGRGRDESRDIASAIVKIMTREFAKHRNINFRGFCTLKIVPATKREFVMLNGKPRTIKKKWRVMQNYNADYKLEISGLKK